MEALLEKDTEMRNALHTATSYRVRNKSVKSTLKSFKKPKNKRKSLESCKCAITSHRELTSLQQFY